MKSKILSELESIRKASGGVLKPESVVEFARNPDTALHERFQWDDTEAARQYRIWQARELIRVIVTLVPGTNKETRAFVSLMNDRENDGGGYRAIVDVLKNPSKRAELVAQALVEAEAWRLKYQQIAELADIFLAIETTGRKRKAG